MVKSKARTVWACCCVLLRLLAVAMVCVGVDSLVLQNSGIPQSTGGFFKTLAASFDGWGPKLFLIPTKKTTQENIDAGGRPRARLMFFFIKTVN